MSSSLIQRKRFIIVFLLAFIILAIGHAIILHEIFNITWKLSIIDSVVYNSILGSACALISIILFYYRPANNSIIIGISIPIIITYCYAFKGSIVLGWVIDSNSPYFIFIDKSIPFRVLIGMLVTSSVAAFSWLWYTIEEQSAVKSRQAKMEGLAKEAELQNLRQKIQPHFLFNSLNSISALAGTRPEEARKMIQQLSDFLRSTLRQEENNMSSVEEEFQQLELYLSIEKVRFGHRLQTLISIDDDCTNLLLPAMILQPVVENAIKFGLYDTIENVRISISVKKILSELVVEVSNPFDPDTTIPSGTGFGLSSIRRRLYLLFTRNDLLVTNTLNQQFITQIRIPQQ